MAPQNQAIQQELLVLTDGQNGALYNTNPTEILRAASNGVPVRADVSQSFLPQLSLGSCQSQQATFSSSYMGSPCQGSFRGPMGLFQRLKAMLFGGGEDSNDSEEKNADPDDEGSGSSYHDDEDDEGTGNCGPCNGSRIKGDDNSRGNIYLANAASQVPFLGTFLMMANNARSNSRTGGCCNGGDRMASNSKSYSAQRASYGFGYGTPLSMLRPGFGPFSNNKTT